MCAEKSLFPPLWRDAPRCGVRTVRKSSLPSCEGERLFGRKQRFRRVLRRQNAGTGLSQGKAARLRQVFFSVRRGRLRAGTRYGGAALRAASRDEGSRREARRGTFFCAGKEKGPEAGMLPDQARPAPGRSFRRGRRRRSAALFWQADSPSPRVRGKSARRTKADAADTGKVRSFSGGRAAPWPALRGPSFLPRAFRAYAARGADPRAGVRADFCAWLPVLPTWC